LKEGKIKYRTIVGKKAKLLQNQAKTAQKIHGWSPLGEKKGGLDIFVHTIWYSDSNYSNYKITSFTQHKQKRKLNS